MLRRTKQRFMGCLSRNLVQRIAFVMLFLIMLAVFWKTDADLSAKMPETEELLGTLPPTCHGWNGGANSSLSRLVSLLSTKYSEYRAEHCSSASKKYLVYRSLCSGNCPKLGERFKGFYLSLLTKRCFGMDWTDASDISAFYQLPIPPVDYRPGQKEFVFPAPSSDDVVLTKHDFSEWKDADVAYYFSNEFSWPNFTQDASFQSSEFAFLSKLNSFDQAHVILRFLFSRRAGILDSHVNNIGAQLCQDDIIIGVHVAEKSLSSNDYLITHCFLPKMIHICRLVDDEGLKSQHQRRRCVFYLTSERAPSGFLAEFATKLDARVEELVSMNREKTSFSMDYRIITAPELSGYSYYLSLLGFQLREAYLNMYLNWEILKSADFLLTSPSSFALSSYWFSGSPSIIVKVLPKSGECQFYPTVRESLYTVLAQK